MTPEPPGNDQTSPIGDNLREQVDTLVGRALLKGLQAMVDGETDVNAALIGKAMEWLDGKGSGGKGKPGDENPIEAMLAAIRKGQEAGGRLPPVSDQDDDATQ